MYTAAFLALTCTLGQADAAVEADVVLQNATLYDGSIVAIGKLG